MLTRRNTLVILMLFVFFIHNNISQNVVSGQVLDTLQINIPQARITLFNAALTFFEEERTSENGRFEFSNVPAGDYILGIAKRGKAYMEMGITVPTTNEIGISLGEESNPGVWETIIESPEPLGGTDLGVLMPDGKIYYCHNTKDPFYFDPVTNDTILAIGDDSIQGCVGPLLTDDGKIWFAGGTLQEVYGPGTRKMKYFDPDDNIWVTQPSMLDYRWYPTVALLPSGNFLIAGGGNLNNPVRTNTSEIYDPETGQSYFTDPMALGNEVSPIAVLYNGKVLMTHRPPQLFDPATNQWDAAGSFVQSPRLPNGDHSDCEIVLMPDGEVIAVGYKSFTPGVYGSFIERYNPDLDSWSLGSSILPIRSRAKTCLLPDKKILVMGGYKEDTTSAMVNQWGYMKLTDLYDPASDSWRRLDDLNYFREYHALTILVPDGRVIAVGGEGQPGNEPPFSVIEGFKPPYLFRGVRPEITNLEQSSFARGGKIELDFAKTDSVTEVILMSNAVVTHFMNSGNNRYLSLDITQSGGHLTASLPIDSVKLMPGFYMLFIMVDDIPSVGEIIHIQDAVADTTQDIGFLDSTFVWTEHHNFMNGDSESYRFTIDDETVMVSGKPFFNVLTAFGEFSENWQGTAMLIRAENNIVYAVGYFGEGELYNFNLMVNDTFNSVLSGNLVVDSIGLIVLENGEERRFWRLHPDYKANPIIWVEGIGNLAGLFAKDCFADCGGTSILCMYRNDTLLYDNPNIDVCWLLPVATNEINDEAIFLTPNPATESINIVGLGPEVKAVSIFNAVGRQVYHGMENRIDLKGIPPGYYYAAILSTNHQYVIKGFVKL